MFLLDLGLGGWLASSYYKRTLSPCAHFHLEGAVHEDFKIQSSEKRRRDLGVAVRGASTSISAKDPSYEHSSAIGGLIFFRNFVFLTIFLVIGFWLLALFMRPTKYSATQVTVCDVGQGDAILVQHGTFIILIDTGPDSSILECLSQEMPFLSSKIDVLILTHSDWDHIGGVESVLESYQVGEVWRTSWSELSASGHRVQVKLDKSQKTRLVKAGETLLVPGARLRILSGEKTREEIGQSNLPKDSPNNRSISLWLQTESFGFLGMGDLECPMELAVIGWSLLNGVDILKASHHGSKTSSCIDLIEKLHPETVVISVGGGNKYGHPHTATLENMVKMGAEVLRTDQLGTFTLESRDGTFVIQR
jgi:competence protein ComEC